MTAEREPRGGEAALPAVARPDGCRVGEQAVLLLLGGQAGERGVQRVVAWQEGFLAVQDRRIRKGD
jgi:hypothetical protein